MARYKAEYEVVYPRIEYGMGMPSQKREVITADSLAEARKKAMKSALAYNKSRKKARMQLVRIEKI